MKYNNYTNMFFPVFHLETLLLVWTLFPLVLALTLVIDVVLLMPSSHPCPHCAPHIIVMLTQAWWWWGHHHLVMPVPLIVLIPLAPTLAALILVLVIAIVSLWQ